MTASCFLDTNILVYSVDEKDKAKQRTARDLIATLVQNDDAIISTQTLQEFYNAATKKLIASKKDAGTFVKQFSDIIPVHSNTVNDVLAAIDISEALSYHFGTLLSWHQPRHAVAQRSIQKT
ncbi:PIN domain-containing protein [Fibrobacter sp.]|uniref:PIN domain-containing protein n=1 Tax=Fibrobacter sp. TaxID=35828 RepID=UPI0025B8DEAA|nr:PIN domain-containing protein [Fibrobacter sp.]MBR2060265.1 PIN domain-containing protein [Fibrobacter sp.]MBR2306263.1 PIN domain-containing protein [Fibrobacter sp.]MBR4007731.1 PIN domain-containing protein [Fibrobacter sp.]